jgi:hypothetical protein
MMLMKKANETSSLIDLPESVQQNLPVPIEKLSGLLKRKGFKVAETFYSEQHFGNYAVVLARWPSAFLIVLDRGNWIVALAGPWHDSPPRIEVESAWFWQQVWEAALEGPQKPTGASKAATLEETVKFFQDRLDEIEALLKTDDQLANRLTDIRKARFKTNFPRWK